MSHAVAAFYRFHALPGHAALREPLLACCQAKDATGILLLAEEGVNATLACPEPAMASLMAGIEAILGFSLEPKFSHAPVAPFKRLKVRLKKEIVAIGDPTVDPTREVGRYVAPKDWNALISDPEVLVIDTRNGFEHAFGSFEGAVDPGTENFSDFPAYVREKLACDRDRPIAMFCTGGIRCEKATSLLVREGFTNVSHLDGGILKYLEDVPAERSLWRGGCFVFDGRVSLTHGLVVADLSLCLNCNAPVDAEGRASPLYEEGVCCAHCAGSQSNESKASARERQRQMRRAMNEGG
ncbi:MAG: rhodanese-related sulfurtransferase [Beijerinckiaceae bacterium]